MHGPELLDHNPGALPRDYHLGPERCWSDLRRCRRDDDGRKREEFVALKDDPEPRSCQFMMALRIAWSAKPEDLTPLHSERP